MLILAASTGTPCAGLFFDSGRNQPPPSPWSPRQAPDQFLADGATPGLPQPSPATSFDSLFPQRRPHGQPPAPPPASAARSPPASSSPTNYTGRRLEGRDIKGREAQSNSPGWKEKISRGEKPTESYIIACNQVDPAASGAGIGPVVRTCRRTWCWYRKPDST